MILVCFLLVARLALAQQVADASRLIERGGEVYCIDQDLPFTGTAIRWLSPGIKAVESNYVNGILNGVETTYNKGKKFIEITFKDGAFEGPYRQWFPNGQLEYEKIYVGGFMNGPAVFYYENGVRQGQGNYTHCKETGEWTFWHPDGKLLKTGLFVEGFEEGTWTFWLESGKKWKEVTYKEGEEVGLKVYNKAESVK
jgi:antitoxin component YwqK of YwqJK toxin-antitoxin module